MPFIGTEFMEFISKMVYMLFDRPRFFYIQRRIRDSQFCPYFFTFGRLSILEESDIRLKGRTRGKFGPSTARITIQRRPKTPKENNRRDQLLKTVLALFPHDYIRVDYEVAWRHTLPNTTFSSLQQRCRYLSTRATETLHMLHSSFPTILSISQRFRRSFVELKRTF